MPKGPINAKLQSERQQNKNTKSNQVSNDENDPVDLTDRRCIIQSTLLVGDSILQDIKNSDLKHNTTVRSFPGAKIETIQSKISNYDISK